MKINEFIEYMQKNANRTMKEDQLLSTVKKILDIKKYIPIGKKKEIIDKIINQCIYYADGVYKIDGIEKYLYFTMYNLYFNPFFNFNKNSNPFNAYLTQQTSEYGIFSALICSITISLSLNISLSNIYLERGLIN